MALARLLSRAANATVHAYVFDPEEREQVIAYGNGHRVGGDKVVYEDVELPGEERAGRRGLRAAAGALAHGTPGLCVRPHARGAAGHAARLLERACCRFGRSPDGRADPWSPAPEPARAPPRRRRRRAAEAAQSALLARSSVGPSRATTVSRTRWLRKYWPSTAKLPATAAVSPR